MNQLSPDHNQENRELFTNTQLIEQIRLGNNTANNVEFTTVVDLTREGLKLGIQSKNSLYSHGLIVKHTRFIADSSFSGSEFLGDVFFEDLLIPKVLDLTNVTASEATMHFNRFKVVGEMADLFLSFKAGTTFPRIVSDDKIILEMVRRLAISSRFVSYQEVRDELE